MSLNQCCTTLQKIWEIGGIKERMPIKRWAELLQKNGLIK